MSVLTRAGGPGAIKRVLASGLAAHQAGRLDEAASAYRSVLAVDPGNADGHHLLGLLALGLGESTVAATHFAEVVRIRPRGAEYRSNYGHALRSLGDLAGATRELEQAVALDPKLVDGWINLGLTRLDGDDLPGAAAALETAVQRGPASAVARLNLGSVHQRLGRLDEALAAYRAAAKLAPELAQAHRNEGIVAQLLGRPAEAESAYRRALALTPDDGDVLTNLGVVLTRLGRLELALAIHDRAVAAAPDLPDGWLNRGTALQAAGRLAEARASFEEAAARDPGPRPRTALGSVAAEAGDLPAAVAAHEEAIARDAGFADGHWNLGLALLAQGRLEAGWNRYEWRWLASNRPAEFRGYPWPVWTGEPLEGRRILVWREQGLGDELMFLTCLEDLIGTGAMVTVLASPRLVTLLQRAFPGADIRPDGPGGLPADARFDHHVPLGSLPGRLRRSPAAFGPAGSYLEPSRPEADRWRRRLATLGDGLRIGICWRSGLRTAERARHYPDLAAWAPMWEIPGVTWINLQYDDCEAELEAIELGGGPRVHRWAGDDLRDDLESVVGLLGSLDAVVTAPTAVSSLAGALGLPIWQVDSGSDWTLLGGSRSPWFPTLRSFRRDPTEAGWGPVMARIGADLSRWVASSRAG